ncbi:MAG TPA: hypothetical protein VFT04_00100 [Gemmatimonadales bacterium]|nr:hypothetical protein [Gemmatimonadales bacterium]
MLVAFAAACGEESPPAREPAVPPPVPVVEGDGIGCLRIGASLAGLPAECRILTDRTIPGPEGMPERRVEILVGSDTVPVTVVGDSLWRAELTAPGLRTADGLAVGSSASELLARPGSRVIGGEGRLFVTLADHCGMSFELGGVPREVLGLPPEAAAERIPPGTRVSRILVFGCEDQS